MKNTLGKNCEKNWARRSLDEMVAGAVADALRNYLRHKRESIAALCWARVNDEYIQPVGLISIGKRGVTLQMFPDTMPSDKSSECIKRSVAEQQIHVSQASSYIAIRIPPIQAGASAFCIIKGRVKFCLESSGSSLSHSFLRAV